MKIKLAQQTPKLMGTATTLRDVAGRAGVNVSTASAVLNGGNNNTRVSQQTRERILQVASELCYYPSAVAKALQRQSTNILGFYSAYCQANVHDLFFSGIVGGLQEGCEAHRKDLLMHGVFHTRPEEEILQELLGGKIDGLILYAPAVGLLIERLVAARLPVVAIVEAVPDFPSVVVDDVRGGALMAQHLARQGHKRALYRLYSNTFSIERRWAGFRETAKEHDLELLTCRAAEPGLSDEEKSLISACGKLGNGITAVACWCDDSACEVLDFCRDQGITVGKNYAAGELAVTGFDGLKLELMQGFCRRLTTIRASWSDVAQTAIDILVARLEETGSSKQDNTEKLLPVELILGDTA